MKTELISAAPAILETAQDLPFPMPLISYLATASILAAGGVADIVSGVNGGPTIIGQAGLSEGGQWGLAGIFLAGFCFASKLILDYHRDRVKELVEEKQKLIARIQELQKEKDADFRRQLDEAKERKNS